MKTDPAPQEPERKASRGMETRIQPKARAMKVKTEPAPQEPGRKARRGMETRTRPRTRAMKAETEAEGTKKKTSREMKTRIRPGAGARKTEPMMAAEARRARETPRATWMQTEPELRTTQPHLRPEAARFRRKIPARKKISVT